MYKNKPKNKTNMMYTIYILCKMVRGSFIIQIVYQIATIMVLTRLLLMEVAPLTCLI